MKTETDDFDPEKRNGVYLFGVTNAYEGYVVDAAGGKARRSVVLVSGLRVDGNYIGGDFEIECSDYEIEDNIMNFIP